MAEAKKQEKEGFFRRTANRFSKWFREMRAELKKVVWESRQSFARLYSLTLRISRSRR